MKSSTQRGIALVITLIMLSVVTVMAIIFLGISRRERVAVGVAASLQDARLAADAGAARAQAEVLARVAASNSLFQYDLMVSTNLVSPNGFDFAQGINAVIVTNVNYWYGPRGSTNQMVRGDDLLKNLGNLWLNPRPPVFVTVPGQPVKDFRYYLDLNRNEVFDTNGWVPVMDRGVWTGRTNWMWGDPEWVGVLERPEYPHSGSNRFVARYAYVAMPAGKSLDINFVHNGVHQFTTDFARNQGVGSWELNLAAFLRRWLPDVYDSGDYVFRTNGTHDGLAFRHAKDVHDFRLDNRAQPPVVEVLGPAKADVLFRNGIDDFGNDLSPQGTALAGTANDDDRPRTAWPAYDYRAAQFRNQEFFQADGGRSSLAPLANLLLAAGKEYNETTNRYAFMRLLSQMGTDSLPANRGKVHLNYTNGFWSHPSRWLDPNTGLWTIPNSSPDLNTLKRSTGVVIEGGETNLVAWAVDRATVVDWVKERAKRTHFMMLATDAILRASFEGDVERGHGLSRGIQVYPTNFYEGAVHRCAQLAANILDTSTRDLASPTNGVQLPSVFRPVFQKVNHFGRTLLMLIGFEEASDTSVLNRLQWVDTGRVAPENLGSVAVTADTAVHGVPWVVGAKKGLPNFNEFYAENVLAVNRRLLARKVGTSVAFEQSYELGVTNLVGIEAWNSYTNAFGLGLQVFYTNSADIWLRDARRHPVTDTNSVVLQRTNDLWGSTNLVSWPGRQAANAAAFQVFSNGVTLVPGWSYRVSDTSLPAKAIVPGLQFDPFPQDSNVAPDWKLEVTNRLFFAMTAQVGGGRQQIVDFVTLNPVVSGFDVTRWLMGETNVAAAANQPDNSFWMTNRVQVRHPRDNLPLPGGVFATQGITNQIFYSFTDGLPLSLWRSVAADGAVRTELQRRAAIDGFRIFLGMPPIWDSRRTNSPGNAMQVPFTAGRRLVQRQSFMANDPMVHYHLADLSSVFSSTNRVEVQRVGTEAEGHNADLPNLRAVNRLYRPWPETSGEAAESYNPGVRDPLVRWSDDWEFPTNALPNVGWLGRVHRGTPWQTVYLKAYMEPPRLWRNYLGKDREDAGWAHPTNDWRLIDQFTATPNANASRGLLSVNQTNEAAWAAVLDGVRVMTNGFKRSLNPSFNPSSTTNYEGIWINSGTPQFAALVRGINETRDRIPGRSFRSMGEVLSSRVLTEWSPYLSISSAVEAATGRALLPTLKVTDVVYETLPQQILGLLRPDEPFLVVYSYGQSLRPAEASLVRRPGRFYGMCTNYEITGEVLTKTAFKIVKVPNTGTNVLYGTELESFSVLPVD